MPADPLMDAHTKKALSATKTLHKRLKELEEQAGEDWSPLKKLAADANRAIQAMKRHASDEAVRADVRENILREAVRDDMIDREANAVRVLDKQRTMIESNAPVSAAFEKAHAAANVVEAAVVALCPHRTKYAVGVALLAEAASSEGSCLESDGP